MTTLRELNAKIEEHQREWPGHWQQQCILGPGPGCYVDKEVAALKTQLSEITAELADIRTREAMLLSIKKNHEDFFGVGSCERPGAKCINENDLNIVRQKIADLTGEAIPSGDGTSATSSQTPRSGQKGSNMSFATKNGSTKLTRVNPLVETAKYVRGTEDGHYYLLVKEDPAAVIGFRPLAVNFAQIGTTPVSVAGQQVRVRVIPTATLTTKQEARLTKLTGMSKKTNDGQVHYSVVTTNPAQVIADAELAL